MVGMGLGPSAVQQQEDLGCERLCKRVRPFMLGKKHVLTCASPHAGCYSGFGSSCSAQVQYWGDGSEE